MKVRDFLSQAIVYRQLVVVRNTQFLGHQFGRVKTDLKSLGRGVLEVRVFFLSNNKQVHRGFRAVIGDYYDLVSLVKNLSRQFAPDNAGEDC